MPKAVIHPNSHANKTGPDLCIFGHWAAAACHLPSLERFLIDCIPSFDSFIIKETEEERKGEREGGKDSKRE